MPHMADGPDEVSERLAALAADLARELGEDATVIVEPVGPNEVVTTITPRSPRALSVEWVDSGDILDLTAGHNGGSWDFLDRDLDDVDFIEQVTRAVIAGRAVEIFAFGRSRVQIRLADGTLVEETGSDLRGCLPLPRWPRWGRRVEYEPYRQ
jgi:hypothetical protein